MLITNFAAGELSPGLNGRTDLQQYYSGAGKLLNFDVIPTGGIRRRAGTERVNDLHGACRLIPFILDSDTSYVFECWPISGTVKYMAYDEVSQQVIEKTATAGTLMYIWKNGDRVLYSGRQIAMLGPWTSLSEIKEVQYAQNYNVMIFTQWDHPPFMMEYDIGTDAFKYGAMSFDFSCDVELDDDYDQVHVWSGSALPNYNVFKDKEGNEKAYYYIIWKESGFLYWWNHDGDIHSGEAVTEIYWEKDTSTEEYEIDTGLFTEENKYPKCVAFFNSRLYFACTRNSPQKVWASAVPDIEGTQYNVFSTYNKYVTTNKVVTDPDIHFFTASATSGETSLTGITQNLYSDLSEEDLEDYYITADAVPVGTQMTDFTWDSSTSTGTATISSAVTADISAAVFSLQKWMYRTTASESDYKYKVVNNNMTTADNSFYFEVASDQNDAIKWLASGRNLVIGTENSTYIVPSSITATNTIAEMDGRYGSDALQATVVQSATIFFAQGKKQIREYYYSADSEAFISQDLAITHPEILESAAVDFDFMTNPYSRLLVTRSDGTVAVLLYEKAEGVQAWAAYELSGGEVESIAVVRGTGGCDLIYLSVYDGETRWLERLDMEKYMYIDSWSLYSTTTAANYNADKAVLYNQTKDEYYLLSDKESHTIETGDIVYIGYLYTSEVESMPIVGSDATGKKRITKLMTRFYKSYKPTLKVTGRDDEKLTNFTEPYSGVKDITYPGDSDRDVTFTLSIEKPYQCTILAINALITE